MDALLLQRCEDARLALETVNKNKERVLEKSIRIELLENKIAAKHEELALAMNRSHSSASKEETVPSTPLSQNDAKINNLEVDIQRLKLDLLMDQRALPKYEEWYRNSLQDVQRILRVNEEEENRKDFPSVPFEISFGGISI